MASGVRRVGSRRSNVLRGDGLNGVGDVVALVDDVLDELVELLAIDVADVSTSPVRSCARSCASAWSKDSSARPSIWPISSHSAKMALWSFATESRNGMTLRRSSALSTIASAIDHISGGNSRTLVALDPLGGVLDEVDGVVQQVGEHEDVLAIDRRIERAVGGDEHPLRHVVGSHFDGANGRDVLLRVDVVHDHLPQFQRRFEDALRLLDRRAR